LSCLTTNPATWSLGIIVVKATTITTISSDIFVFIIFTQLQQTGNNSDVGGGGLA